MMIKDEVDNFIEKWFKDPENFKYKNDGKQEIDVTI